MPWTQHPEHLNEKVVAPPRPTFSDAVRTSFPATNESCLEKEATFHHIRAWLDS